MTDLDLISLQIPKMQAVMLLDILSVGKAMLDGDLGTALLTGNAAAKRLMKHQDEQRALYASLTAMTHATIADTMATLAEDYELLEAE